jgi:hypothetical protein
MKIDYIETWFIADDSRVKKPTKYMHINSDIVHVHDDSTLVYRHYYRKI